MELNGKKVALVHDFLNQYGGAEKVLEAIYSLFLLKARRLWLVVNLRQLSLRIVADRTAVPIEILNAIS